MDNSPAQPGQDLFKVKIFVSRGRYDGITLEKEDSNLYIALADVVDHMLEALNRYGDRVRVKEIKVARQLNREMGQGGERDMGHNSEDNERIHD
jgi:ribosome-associated translation inhibitor RaiA